MISALLAFHLTVAPPTGRTEGSSLHASPMALGGDRSSWRTARRAIRRDKRGTESKSPRVLLATAGFRLPTERATRLYSASLLPPARPAATPRSERDPPSRDQEL